MTGSPQTPDAARSASLLRLYLTVRLARPRPHRVVYRDAAGPVVGGTSSVVGVIAPGTDTAVSVRSDGTVPGVATAAVTVDPVTFG